MRLHHSPFARSLGWCPTFLLVASLAWSAPERFIPYGSRVAVLDPWSGTHGDPESKEIGDSLRSHLGENVTLVPVRNSYSPGTAAPAPDSCADLECATRWGKMVGADRVVFGTLTSAGNGRSLVIRVVDPAQSGILQTLFENKTDTASLARLARTAASHLMGKDDNPVLASSPLIAHSPSKFDLEMFTLQESRSEASRIAIAAGASAAFLAAGALFSLEKALSCGLNGSENSERRNCDSEDGALTFFVISTGASGVIFISQLLRLDVTNTKIRALEKQRKAAFQILPYVDPVHGSAGMLARAGF